MDSIELMLSTNKYRGLQELYFALIVLSMTILILKDLLDMRQHLQAVFFYQHHNDSDDGVTLMKLRTVQLKGILNHKLNS